MSSSKPPLALVPKGTAMKKRKAIKQTAKAKPAPKSKLSGTPPVEKAWLKFVNKFLAFQEMPHKEGDKEINIFLRRRCAP